ncbi:MAG: BrnT family toxin [bacterium]|nr:BrnT family toxin [bacterium]
MDYYFVWDPKKAGSNSRKHGVSFETASTVFHDPRALSIFDDKHSIEEDRWITLGMDSSGVLTVVCHTFEEEAEDSYRIRVFSARRATRTEIEEYGG